MKRWIDPISVQVPPALQDLVGGHPLVAETLVRRGITSVAEAKAFLDPAAYTPAPASDFPDMKKVVQRLAHAIQRKERICVWGDFDVDGQTSTTVLVATLRDMGADVIYHIPVRDVESHGVRIPWLQAEIDKGTQIFLTCDTGIDAVESIAYANERHIDTVITDHHELPSELPAAHAILNPHLLPAGHPLETLPGVGVAYKLSEALYQWAHRPEDAAQHLDLVALGIVADVAIQTGDTRYLLQLGLEGLRRNPRLGLQELMRWANIRPDHLSSQDIGFGLAPRLNALGRLGDANVSVEFLTTMDLSQARIMASQLEATNTQRKALCEKVLNEAQVQIEENSDLLDDAALVLFNATWPAGVVGIVANRLVEKYHRPTILLTGTDDTLVHGSARSVKGCNITEAIANVKDLVANFGGHEMAAGLALPSKNITALRRQLSENVAEQLGKAGLQPTRNIDCYLTLPELSMALVEDIERLAPFGAGNPALCLATRNVHIIGQRTLGRDGNHLLATLEDAEGNSQKAVWWHWDGAPIPEETFDLAYTLRINKYRGKQELQIIWEEAREIPAVTVSLPSGSELEIIDYRREPHPTTLLKPLLEQDNVQIWCEGPESGEIPGKNRWELQPDDNLVIWTIPPGPNELQAALAQVSPRTIYLFREETKLEQLKPFLTHLAGLVKHVLSHHQGDAPLVKLAALVAHRESTVRLGLAWLEAQGHLSISISPDHIVHIEQTHTNQGTQRTVQNIIEQLSVALVETRAFRHYFARTDAENLRQLILTAEEQNPT